MSEESARADVVVSNPHGLHLRPAYLLAGVAEKFHSKVELIKDGERVDAKSILSIAGLGAECGTKLQIAAKGADAQAAVKALLDLFEKELNREPKEGDSSTEEALRGAPESLD